jgi:hypothetical protein
MAAFVTVKMLMMAANVVNLTMPAFINDGCNYCKNVFQMVSICRLIVGH